MNQPKTVTSDQFNNAIKKLTDTYQQALYVSRLEDLCFNLKNAIIDLNLKFPCLVSFERYLLKLTDTNDILYIMELLHQCWVYVHPNYLFDRPIKASFNTGKCLDYVWKNSKAKGNHSFSFINNEVNRNNFTALELLYVKAYSNVQPKLEQVFRKYFEGLWEISNGVCESKQIKLAEDFTVQMALVTNLTPVQIDAVFNVLAASGKINSGNDNRIIFKAMFDTTANVAEGKILWLDRAKSKTPNYASLYLLFKTMGVKMEKHEKAIICRFFKVVDENGEETGIDPLKLKSRTRNDNGSRQSENRRTLSKQLVEFEKQLKDAIKLSASDAIAQK